MTAHEKKFVFADRAIPSLAEVRIRVKADTSFPEQRRRQLLSSLGRLEAWTGSSPDALPFAPRVVRGLLAKLTPAGIGRSKKRLQNVRSDLNFLMIRYRPGGCARYLAPLAPEWVELRDGLKTEYEVRSLKRMMHFASAQGISPHEFRR
jgi:hypothetical protein